MLQKCLLSFAFISLLSAALVAQSPWPRSKAGFYAQAAWHFIPAYEEVFPRSPGYSPLDRRLSENTFQLYGEYGVSRATTLTASLPLRLVSAGDFLGNFATPETESGSLFGMGNVSLGIRQSILKSNVQLSASLRIDLPVDNYDDATGLSTGYKAWAALPMLSAGMGFGRGYGFVYGGYGFRSDKFSQFVNLGIEGGFRIKKLWLIGFSEWMSSVENGNVNEPLRNRLTALYVDEQSWLSIGVKGILEFNRFWGVLASAAGASDGQWVPKKPGFSIGTYFKWD